MATTTSGSNSNGCSSPKERVVTNGTSNKTSPQQNQQQNQQQTQQQTQQQARFIPFDNCKTEQIALLTALSQVVSCTQEAVKILRESQVIFTLNFIVLIFSFFNFTDTFRHIPHLAIKFYSLTLTILQIFYVLRFRI